MGSSVILPSPGQPKQGPDPTFKSAAVPNLVSFALEKISPPSPLYLQRDDILLLFMITQRSAGDTVTFVARFLQAAPDVAGQPDKPPNVPLGQAGGLVTQTIKTVVQPITGTQRGIQLLVLPLTEGYLLSISATAGNAISRGLTYAQAGIQRRAAGGTSIVLPLFSDYCTSTYVPGWPGGRVLAPVEGSGSLVSVQVLNPGGGNDWILTVPTATRWRIQTMEAQLAVANSGAPRPVEIVVDDGANIVARMATNTTAPINATANVNFSNAGTPPTTITADIYAQMPAGLVLTQAMRVRSVTTNIVAGDAWTNIFFLMEQWVDL